MAEALVICEHLVKVYDSPTGRVQAVRGIDLEIESGVTTAIVGRSGSGKSSLLRMVAGIDVPTAGTVTIAGENLLEMRPGLRARRRGRLLTHVYQRPDDNLLGHLTAEQQLLRIARPRRGAAERIAATLTSLGLIHRRDHVPDQMSGGERQRLALARAVVAGHRLVIADEPTAELDSASASAVLDVVDRLADGGVTVLLATHDPRVVRRMERVVTLRDGAVASITHSGAEHAVIDRAGRLQLPPDIRTRFPDGAAVLHWDEDHGGLRVDPP